jgi:Na+(H+)/acetate symporter ActP
MHRPLIIALLLALFAPQSIFARVLFAWHTVGSAFGPLLVALLAGWRIPMSVRIVAMLAGAVLTVTLHWLDGTPGDVAERLLPLFASAAIVVLGRDRR